MRVHPFYSGSNAHRFTACHGQPALAALVPDIDTSESLEGTWAHRVLEWCVQNDARDANFLVGWQQIDGRYVDQEAAESVQHVLDYIAELRLAYPDLQVFAEISFAWPGLDFHHAGGTVDIFWSSLEARKAGIVDFKHGRGVAVRADQNKQGLFYWVCVLQDAPGPPDALFTVIQPRRHDYEGPLHFQITFADLYDFKLDVLDAMADPQGPRVTGAHCRMCKAAGICPEREALAVEHLPMAYVTSDRRDTIALPADLVKLGQIASRGEDLKAYVRDCEKLARTLALRGQHIPGCKLVEDAPRRQYLPDATPEQMAGFIVRESRETLTLDDVMPRKLLPLTKAEALLVQAAREHAIGSKDDAARRAREAFAFLTPKASKGGISLVPETDPRPAFTGLDPAADFGNVVIIPPW